jgi:hypothetical protein
LIALQMPTRIRAWTALQMPTRIRAWTALQMPTSIRAGDARVGQPHPLAARARCGQGDRPSPHGVRNPCAEHPASLSDLAGTLFSGCHGADRFRDCLLRRPTPRHPSASCFIDGATDSRSASRPVVQGPVSAARQTRQCRHPRTGELARSFGHPAQKGPQALDCCVFDESRAGSPAFDVAPPRSAEDNGFKAQTKMSERGGRDRHNKTARLRE